MAPPKSAAAETPSAEAMRIAVIYDLLTSQERARFIRMFVAALDPRAELDPIKEMANQSLQDLIDEHRKSRPADLTNLHEMPPPRPIRQISNPARKAAKRREIKR